MSGDMFHVKRCELKRKPGSELKRSWIKRGPPRAKSKKPSKLPPEPRQGKERRLEDPEYLAFIRHQPCLVPGCRCRPVEAHHYGERGLGQKCRDDETAPLCWFHHRPWWHDRGHLPGMTPEESRELIKSTGQKLRARWESER